MSERASPGVFPLVLFALIVAISAIAVVMGGEDAKSAATAADRPGATAAGTAAGRADSR